MEDAFPGLAFEKPVAILSPPGETNRLFILEQPGRIIVVTNLAEPTRTIFMDISPQVYHESESGLLGMAFHPQYASNGRFYLFYSLDASTEGALLFHNRLARFEVAPYNPNVGLPASETVLISQPDPNKWHNAGDIHFGPDGYLYASLGDGGGGYDQYQNSQQIDKNFFSGILRIDVDMRTSNFLPNPHPAIVGTNYLVPADNPFMSTAEINGQNVNPAKVRTELFAIGMRNPWRLTIDPLTGRLFSIDTGQDRYEEINLITKGGNNGWLAREGHHIHTNLWQGFYSNIFYVPPIVAYGREYGNGIAATVFYRGNSYPQLRGKLLFSDFWGGNIWAIQYSDTSVELQINELERAIARVQLILDTATEEIETAQADWEAMISPNQLPSYIIDILMVPASLRNEQQNRIIAIFYRSITPLLEAQREEINVLRTQLAGTIIENPMPMELIGTDRGISSMAIHPGTGEILLSNWLEGKIKVLAATEPHGVPIPKTLAETGVFSDLHTLTPHAGVVPYEVNVPFWSDYATKSRWFSLPNTNQFIMFNVNAHWEIPTGAIWVKHFDLEMIRGLPDSRRRVETRFLVRTETGVYGLSYKWDASQTNAELVSAEGLTETILIEEDGMIRPQVWRYPSRNECLLCHTEVAGFALAFNTPQLNRYTTTFGIPENQISMLSQMGYFADTLPPHDDDWPRLSDANDATETLTWRVRSYLHSNCVQCHQPGGAGRDSWDARLSVALENSGIIDGLPNDTLGIPDGRIVKPGVLDDSVLFKRISEMGSHHMPPLATTELNHRAVDLVAQWILLKAPSLAIGANVPPTIKIINPLEGARYSDDAVLNIVIGATDEDDGVASVEIFGNGNSLGILTNQPFELAWANIPEGDHTISAVATDNSGAVVNSRDVQFRVVKNPQLLLDAPRAIEHGWVELRLAGPESATVLVESSSNLEQWHPISTNQIRAGELKTAEALDVAKTNTFYRGSIIASP